MSQGEEETAVRRVESNEVRHFYWRVYDGDIYWYVSTLALVMVEAVKLATR